MICLAAGLIGPGAVHGQARDAPIPHVAGQSVSPSFEGWYPNPDGTFSLSFGYFNRNFEETLDLPVGSLNRFEPGPADRGQPTHFLPRRQTGVFTVVVPADFEDQWLEWSLTAGGETITIPGHLRPEWQIDALHEITSGNRPPRVRLAPGHAGGQGPGGPEHAIDGTVGQPVSLTVWVEDDGVMKRPSDRPPRLGVVWSTYRGPGPVDIAEPAPAVGDDGSAQTSATFHEPGTYVLRVLAWDDSGPQGPIMAGGFQCCWTNAYLTVQVQ